MAARMSQASVEVLVVGGGPAGLYAAQQIARRGHSVLVCEEHDTVGRPVHCTGVLATDSFTDFDLPANVRLNALSSARFVSPSGLVVDYETPSPLATVIDRVAFDAALAARAKAAGADMRVGARVSSIERHRGGMTVIAGDSCIETRL